MTEKKLGFVKWGGTIIPTFKHDSEWTCEIRGQYYRVAAGKEVINEDGKLIEIAANK